VAAAGDRTGRPPLEVCAHRGDSSRYRENTLPAIRSAIAAGADYVEIDVRVTADGSVVVLHDATLERLWGRPVAVGDITAAQVADLGGPDDRPPLLSEVLELFEGASSTLLIDMDEPGPAEPAFRVASRFDAHVAWCGHLEAMQVLRSLDPEARIWLPWHQPQAPSAEDLAALRPERVNSPFLVMTREVVDQVHRLGCKVTVWTVDDEPTMRWARDIGVDTVTSNQLALLQRVGSEDAVDEGHRDDGSLGGLDLDEALVVARGLARWAMAFTRETGPGEVSAKKDAADLVTEVDVAVERRVREVVGHHFPDHGFVGEEMGGHPEPRTPCWYLDPVDGTANLANRVPWNAFSLALVLDDMPLVAVVADPWRGELFEAVLGRGARLNGAPLSLPQGRSTEDPLRGRIVSTELANHVPWPGMLELLERLGERYCTLRIMGSGTLTVVGVAAGRGAGAVIGRFGAVDHVAAALIVQEAGGVVLDAHGKPNLFPEEGGILAAAPEAAAALHELWEESCRQHQQRSALAPEPVPAQGEG
jgi:myo-inositol-1(or 4)-monophosphatase